MAITEKIKTIDNSIDEIQFDEIIITFKIIDRQTAIISALPSRNVSKHEFVTGKDVLPGKDFLEKAATMKRFECSSLDKELKAQTENTKKQQQSQPRVANLIKQ